MLEFYTGYFDTVELNTTFYRLPPDTGLNTWRDSTPSDSVSPPKAAAS